MTTRRLAVVSAGSSVPSATRLLADRLTTATAAALHRRSVAAEIETVELREHAHALIDRTLTGVATGRLDAAIDAVTGADGLIAVTPVFSASYNGLFKLFFDVLDADVLAGRPTLLAATGGTARHSLVLDHAMRPLFAHLRALVVPTAVFAAPEDWGGGDTATAGLGARIDRAADELADLVAARPATATTDPFADPTPFTRLLQDAGR